MKEQSPSWTALHVARHRAVHQTIDDPKVFDDPIAPLILSVNDVPQSRPKWPDDHPILRGLRAFVVARSRYAEDQLHGAVRRGVGQYVILGAGLDTFAYRNPYPHGVLRIFEVDYPATQKWKRTCLLDSGIPIPSALTFTPVDFENRTLEEGLSAVGFDKAMSTFFSCLGVVPYLSLAAITQTFGLVASLPQGSAIVFDYHVSPSSLGQNERMASDIIADRVAQAGEPFKTFFDPGSLKSTLSSMGFAQTDDMDGDAINALYFQDRSDGLKVFHGRSHLMNARV